MHRTGCPTCVGVPDPLHEGSAAEYVPPGHIPEADGSACRILRMREAKLHRCIVVDAEDSLEPAGDLQSDAGDSPSGSGSGCESGSGHGSGSASDASDGDATSNAVTVSRSDPEAAALAPPPQKKFRRTTPRAGHSFSQQPAPIVVDVDAASSSAPVTHLLSEGDFFPTDTDGALHQQTGLGGRGAVVEGGQAVGGGGGTRRSVSWVRHRDPVIGHGWPW